MRFIDLGRAAGDAGDAGGRIVAQAPPGQVAKSETSRTIPFLNKVLGQNAGEIDSTSGGFP